MSRNNTTSRQADNDDDLDDINNLLMIESGVTKKLKSGELKDDHFYSLNNTKDTLSWMMVTRRIKPLRNFSF